MPPGGHWKRPVPNAPKCKKTRGKHWNLRNFPSINWTVNARKQAFTWIHRNSLSQKIYARLLSGKMQEKHKKTSENAGRHNNFRAFTERWTLQNMHFLEFPWIRRLKKYKKTGENVCECGNAFRTLTKQWILVNCVLCEIQRHLPLWKIRENAGFQL